eukprot:3338473-Prymnesium_polylepis.1
MPLASSPLPSTRPSRPLVKFASSSASAAVLAAAFLASTTAALSAFNVSSDWSCDRRAAARSSLSATPFEYDYFAFALAGSTVSSNELMSMSVDARKGDDAKSRRQMRDRQHRRGQHRTSDGDLDRLHVVRADVVAQSASVKCILPKHRFCPYFTPRDH